MLQVPRASSAAAASPAMRPCFARACRLARAHLGWLASFEDPTLTKRDFLSAAGKELNRSLDLADTLERVTRAAVPVLADCCAVDVFSADWSLSNHAVAATLEEDELLLREQRTSARAGRPESSTALACTKGAPWGVKSTRRARSPAGASASNDSSASRSSPASSSACSSSAGGPV